MEYVLQNSSTLAWPVYEATWHVSSHYTDALSPLSLFTLRALGQGETAESIASITCLSIVLIEEEIMQFERQQLWKDGQFTELGERYVHLLHLLDAIQQLDVPIYIEGVTGQMVKNDQEAVNQVSPGHIPLHANVTTAFFDNPNYENSYDFIQPYIEHLPHYDEWADTLNVHITLTSTYYLYVPVTIKRLPIQPSYSAFHCFVELFQPSVSFRGEKWKDAERLYPAFEQFGQGYLHFLTNEAKFYYVELKRMKQLKKQLEEALFHPYERRPLSKEEVAATRQSIENDWWICSEGHLQAFEEDLALQYEDVQIEWTPSGRSAKQYIDMERLRQEVFSV